MAVLRKTPEFFGAWIDDAFFAPVITVRCGSSLKDKCLREYHGKSLMVSAIEKAIAAYGSVSVLADSYRYADIARRHGAHIPFLRERANDTVGVEDPLREFLAHVRQNHVVDEAKKIFVVLIQCTSPNTSVQTLTGICETALEEGSGTMTATGYRLSVKPNCIFTEGEYNGKKRFYHLMTNAPETTYPRQKLPAVYALSGGAFVLPSQLLDGFQPFRSPVRIYPVSIDEALDIDTEEDFLK